MNLKTLLTIYMTMTLVISCSEVKFSNAPSPICASADSCVANPNGETITKTISVPFPNSQVDILFVVDNSRTMLEEQSKMVSRLQGFLDRISNLDYRIAIATTDNDAANRTNLYNPQDYRDGKLVPFLASNNGLGGSTYAKDSNGNLIYFITKTTPQATTLFQNTIYRPESAWCKNNQSACPSVVSGDERGIYTATRNIRSDGRGFIRAAAQLHVVIIADEDERSNGGGFPGLAFGGQYTDSPDDLLNVLRGLNKRTRVHSIVDLPAAGTSFEACVASQINDTTRQEYKGCHYIKASSGSGGITASKNEADYSGILSAIGNDIDNTAISTFAFSCRPTEVVIESVNGMPYPSGLANPTIITNHGSESINFNPAIQPGQAVKIKWTCPRT